MRRVSQMGWTVITAHFTSLLRNRVPTLGSCAHIRPNVSYVLTIVEKYFAWKSRVAWFARELRAVWLM